MREPGLPCDVWIADITWPQPDHVDLLDPAETARLGKFRLLADRARFVTATALLRLVVAAKLGSDPHALVVDRSCDCCGQPHGKPRIPGSGVFVSLSHSGDLAALAVTEVAPVGVDVEVKNSRDLDGLARTILSANEVVGEPDDFYTYWCRKEAVVKATGAGLRMPLVDVVVTRADQPARLLSYQHEPLECSVRDLDAAPGYAAAVAVLAAGHLEIRHQDARQVLCGEPVFSPTAVGPRSTS